LLALHPIPGVRNLRAPYDVTGMCLYRLEDVEMRMPCDVGDFTDFYASRRVLSHTGPHTTPSAW
jgi:fumarylacetoacetase